MEEQKKGNHRKYLPLTLHKQETSLTVQMILKVLPTSCPTTDVLLWFQAKKKMQDLGKDKIAV